MAERAGHLIAFAAGAVGVLFALATVYGYLQRFDDWVSMGQYAVGLLVAGAGLEYGQTRIEGTLQKPR
ncbi:hypothetical protein AU468_03410 [Alkalispirochaeta sphaeroplastigenens]|uniref:Uncharacterized protein n=1 Tax=Alkalispirochaeta sphaeroplastigenens TaxID=1187066 RepID=A0A2S4JXE0_9SPIO|nr:hypothetical protein [Alkalispirochaeta sphaeroplastigenens]POR04184.1 hypothetical protein AU468_03410 [Alkalispirochaeta sphaeroplastigenens]